MQIHILTIGADEGGGDRAVKRQSTTVAERRANEAHLRPTVAANVTFLGRGAVRFAELAHGRIQKSQASFEPVAGGFAERLHTVEVILFALNGKEKVLFARLLGL
jgi:hypothetical protein